MTENAQLDDFDFNGLRRFPDVEAPNLFASDASDRLILATAAATLSALDDGRLAIMGDRYGALTLAAAAVFGATGIRVHQDGRSSELALRNNAARLGGAGSFRQLPLGPELFDGVSVVLWQLPRGLHELSEVADLMARHAGDDVQVFAGGRVKHMTPAMKELLRESFGTVTAGLARQKSRVLTAREPRRPAGPTRYPQREYNAELGLWICAHGATFAGTKLDIGSRYLLDFAAEMKPDAHRAIDLGCGSGVLAAALAARRPDLRVTATDQSAAAVASAKATAATNSLTGRIDVVHDDAMASFPDESAELIILNPPFHVGSSVHAGAALKLFDAAARVLSPGGELWTVFNNHLGYIGQLEQRVGRTEVRGRTAKFTVAVSTKSSGGGSRTIADRNSQQHFGSGAENYASERTWAKVCSPKRLNGGLSSE
ncbi:methyltransferase [Paenarthrobacter sp. Z7-10]|uniref:class I SAM-dependent methyltransferase n=1 Tax=Paenarthrobacter sp. Z7-10 TaxID=2787635 RepID=UPI0022A8D949|nr:methyltransferase [Paenarthrobacter sp. Z7-10]MCZ2404375.1 methyltransferase [Paenarthrobacter sp. Z7-10]